MHESFTIDLLVALLIVTAAVAMTVKWVRLPYSIALVIVGLLIGAFHILPAVEITPSLILLVFLPALLFEASWNIDIGALKEDWRPIGLLATVGVVLTMGIVAVCMHSLAGLAWRPAFLFGAMISATDPISLVALFRKIGMNKRLTIILEGESLFNDGTAVVLFKLVLAIIFAGSAVSLENTAGSFIVVVLGGAIIGWALGYAASRITSVFEDHLLEITITVVLAYGSFLLADQLHVSPVLSVITAGIVMGSYGKRTVMSPIARLAVNAFWEYTAFVLTSLLFLLIGLQIKFDTLGKYALQIGVGIAAILVARAIVIYGLAPILSDRSRSLPVTWRHLLFWGALRGSLCMALALSLPISFEYRELITITTFGVVLFTLLVPGLTMEPLVRRLGMAKPNPKLERYRELNARLMAKTKALAFLSGEFKVGAVSKAVFDKIHLELENAQDNLRERIKDLQLSDASIKSLEEGQTRQRILQLESDCLSALASAGTLSEDALQKLRLAIDRRLRQASDADAMSGEGSINGEERP